MDIRRNSLSSALQVSSLRTAALETPSTPAAKEETWGSQLRDLSQQGLQKGVDALKKKGTWKETDSSKHNSSSSIGNVGGEKLPDNLSHLGDWGKGTTLAEWEWHALRVGDVDYKDSG